MKRIVLIVLTVLFLTGCSSDGGEMKRALSLREKILSGSACSFETVISADYADKVYTFEMKCRMDRNGTMAFEVIMPETISGVTGTVDYDSGKLTFNEDALLFEVLADGEITPVSAPWAMFTALKSGYIKGCGKQQDGLYMQIDDTYEDKALTVDLYTDAQDIPIRGEIIWEGRRVVSMDVKNFIIL